MMRDPNAQTLTNYQLVDEMRKRREKNRMNHPISVIIYPLFGGWRAECRSCGAYGNSEETKYKSNISVALDNLAKNEHSYSEASKTCNHYYGNYKPRVNCYIDFNNLKYIKEPFTKKGDAKFPAINLDNKIDVSVFNAKNLTHEWSAYSYARYMQQQDLKAKEEKAFAMAHDNLENIVSEAKDIVEELPGKRNLISPSLYANLKTLSIAITLAILFSLVVGETLNCTKSFYLILLAIQITNVLCRGYVEYVYKKLQ